MRRSKLYIGLLLLLIPGATLTAQELQLSAEDLKPTIRGTLGGNTSSFSKTITISIVGDIKEPLVLKVRKFDLAEKGGPGFIERSNIFLPSVTFTTDQPQQDVTLTVNNVIRFGTFEGDIDIFLPGKSPTKLKLTVAISPKIEVKAQAAAAVQLVRCSPLPCPLTRWLPASLVGEQRWLLLDNQTPIPAKVSDYAIALQGQKTAQLVTSGDVLFNPPRDLMLPARQPASIEMKFDTNKLRPDRYVGTLKFNVENSDVQPTVNFTVDVREAPWWALLALLVGVLLGRLIKSMNTPEALMQVKLVGRANRIESSSSTLRDPVDKEILMDRLEAIRKRIDAANETEQALTQDLAKLETEIRFLNELQDLQDSVRLHAKPEVKQLLLDKLLQAKRAMLEGNAEQSIKLVNEVSTQLRSSGDSLTREDKADFDTLLDAVDDAQREGSNVLSALDEKPAPRPGFASRALSTLAGTRLITANVRFWLRSLFFLLLLLLLVLIGLKTLYLDHGANFGSEGLYDYLSLILWGMSADVVQRTLQNLELPKAA